MKFSKPPSEISFPEQELEILKLWRDGDTFQRSVNERDPKNNFAFYDGPPFATGLPHHGHLLAGTIKDVVPRFWTMRGKRVERRFGWDCHGLPVEFEMEKTLDLKGRKDILNYGVDKFNEACRSIVLRYTEQWRQTVERLGRWIDFDNDYKTMDLDFMESVWAVFKQLWDKGLIYEDRKTLPYSVRITTPLSNFEANLNYKDVQDPSVTVKLKMVGEENTYLLIWTTTPWTLPGNLLVAAHPTAEYVRVTDKDTNENYVLQRSRLSELAFEPSADVIETLAKGYLADKKYEPLFAVKGEAIPDDAYRVVLDDFVTDDSGTGLVHIAPGFGEDDFRIGKANDMPPLDHLDDEGIIRDVVPDFAGLYFKDADKKIMQNLKSRGLLYNQSTIQHSYPYCYRSDTPLIYRTVATWFVDVEKIKNELIANNSKIHWVPEHLKEGRFGKWLDGARDWAISRNRFWGNPIPIWRDEDGEETLCIGSRDELEKLTGQKIDDLHKHFIDDLEIKSPKTGKILKRIPHVLDCWFESGSMPYAQTHYPFATNDEELKKVFPADFIAEGLDQTRGWFYTLLVLSTALGKGPAFKNVIVNGIVLAEDGRKMSKRHKNYPSPDEVFDEFGADTLRIYLLQSGAVRAEDLRFSSEGMRDMTRKVLLPIWNAYSFLATYAHVDGFDVEKDYVESRDHGLDQWITLKLEDLKDTVIQEMEDYQLSRTIPPIISFIDDLTNWYIRRSRRRFWKSENDGDKFAAYSTLYRVLVDLSKIIAPFTPFLAESLYQKLRLGHTSAAKDSVHLDSFPEPRKLSGEETRLLKRMALARDVVNLGRELREKVKIKIRQPLSTLYVGVVEPWQEDELKLVIDIIQDELNIKEVTFLPSADMAIWDVKPNFRLLGKKLGKRIKDFQNAVSKLTADQVMKLLHGEELEVLEELYGRDAFLIDLKAKDTFAHPCHSSGDLVIALNTNISEELKSEGLAREVINRVQRFRKEIDLNVEDRIQLFVHGAQMEKALKEQTALIEAETLSQLAFTKPPSGARTSEEKIEGDRISIAIVKRH